MDHDRLRELEELATAATVNAVDAQQRENASNALRFLCHSNSIPQLKEILQRTHNVNLLFVALKAMQFFVANEIGPADRREVSSFVCSTLRQHLEKPRFVIRMFYRVMAWAMYLNWRSALLFSSSEDINSATFHMLNEIYAQLPTVEALECLTEVVRTFHEESDRGEIESIRRSFSLNTLPILLKLGVDFLWEHRSHFPGSDVESEKEKEYVNEREKALHLCMAIADLAVPRALQPLVPFNCTSEDSISMVPTEEGLCSLQRLSLLFEAMVRARVSAVAELIEWQTLVASLSRLHIMEQEPAVREALLTIRVQWIECSLAMMQRAKGESGEQGQRLAALVCRTVVNVLERCPDIPMSHEGTVRKPLEDVVRWAIGVAQRPREEDAMELHTVLLQLVEAYVNMDEISPLVRDVVCAFLDSRIRESPLVESSEIVHGENFVLNYVEGEMQLLGILLCHEQLFEAVIVRWETFLALYQLCHAASMDQLDPSNSDAYMALCVDTIGFTSSPHNTQSICAVRQVVLSRLATLMCVAAVVLRRKMIQLGGRVVALTDLPVVKVCVEMAGFAENAFSPAQEISGLLQQVSFGASEVGLPAVPTLHAGLMRAFVYLCSVMIRFQGELQNAAFSCASLLLTFGLSRHSFSLFVVHDLAWLMKDTLEATIPLIDANCAVALINAVRRGDVKLILGTETYDANLPVSHQSMLLARREALSLLSRVADDCSAISGYHDAAPQFFSWLLERYCDGCNTLLLLTDIQGSADGIVREEGANSLLNILSRSKGWSRLLGEHGNVETVAEMTALLASVAAICRMCARCLLMDYRSVERARWTSATLRIVRVGLPIVSASPQSISALYDAAHALASCCAGTWTNIGLAQFYEPANFRCVVQLIFCMLSQHHATELWSSPSDAEELFRAVSQLLELTGVPDGVDANQMLFRLSECFSYRPLRCVAACVSRLWQCCAPSAVFDSSAVMKSFESILVEMISGTAEPSDGELLCGMLTSMHRLFPAMIEQRMEQLLSYVSAHHRIRIRLLLSMFQEGESENAAKHYTTIFGKQPKMASIFAWKRYCVVLSLMVILEALRELRAACRWHRSVEKPLRIADTIDTTFGEDTDVAFGGVVPNALLQKFLEAIQNEEVVAGELRRLLEDSGSLSDVSRTESALRTLVDAPAEAIKILEAVPRSLQREEQGLYADRLCGQFIKILVEASLSPFLISKFVKLALSRGCGPHLARAMVHSVQDAKELTYVSRLAEQLHEFENFFFRPAAAFVPALVDVGMGELIGGVIPLLSSLATHGSLPKALVKHLIKAKRFVVREVCRVLPLSQLNDVAHAAIERWCGSTSVIADANPELTNALLYSALRREVEGLHRIPAGISARLSSHRPEIRREGALVAAKYATLLGPSHNDASSSIAKEWTALLQEWEGEDGTFLEKGCSSTPSDWRHGKSAYPILAELAAQHSFAPDAVIDFDVSTTEFVAERNEIVKQEFISEPQHFSVLQAYTALTAMKPAGSIEEDSRIAAVLKLPLLIQNAPSLEGLNVHVPQLVPVLMSIDLPSPPELEQQLKTARQKALEILATRRLEATMATVEKELCGNFHGISNALLALRAVDGAVRSLATQPSTHSSDVGRSGWGKPPARRYPPMEMGAHPSVDAVRMPTPKRVSAKLLRQKPLITSNELSNGWRVVIGSMGRVLACNGLHGLARQHDLPYVALAVFQVMISVVTLLPFGVRQCGDEIGPPLLVVATEHPNPAIRNAAWVVLEVCTERDALSSELLLQVRERGLQAVNRGGSSEERDSAMRILSKIAARAVGQIAEMEF